MFDTIVDSADMKVFKMYAERIILLFGVLLVTLFCLNFFTGFQLASAVSFGTLSVLCFVSFFLSKKGKFIVGWYLLTFGALCILCLEPYFQLYDPVITYREIIANMLGIIILYIFSAFFLGHRSLAVCAVFATISFSVLFIVDGNISFHGNEIFILGTLIGAAVEIYLTALLLDSFIKRTKETNESLRQTGMELRASNDEKDLLLKEIHHRVKNNLQIVTSMLNLQANQVPDDHLKSLIKESQNRISAMAMIHENLYQELNFAKVNFSEYVKDLVRTVSRIYEDFHKEIRFAFDLPNISLDMNRSIYCGLIINELITNSIKHAFFNIEDPLIILSMWEDHGQFVIRIEDNGSGFGNGQTDSDGLGYTLVRALIGQLHGHLDYPEEGSSEISFAFPKSATEPYVNPVVH